MKRMCWAFGTTLFIIILSYSTTCLAQTQTQAHTAYYSWHQEPSANYYCSNVPCHDQTLGSHEECVVDRLSCPGGFKIVQSNIMGYKTRNDVNDSKIAINQEHWNNGGLLDEAQWRLPSINAINPAGIGFPLDSGKTDRFRVFVPPGVSYLSLSLFCPRDDYLAVAVRWKQPPCENCVSVGSNADYEAFSFDRENEYTLSVLEERDVYLQNAGGHITLYSGGPGVTVDEGGWLYVYTFFSRSRHINSSSYFARIEYTVRVNAGVYRQFYNTAAQWDAFGDPLPAGAAPNQYSLTVTPSGTGTGLITSDIGGIACSEAGADGCSKPFDSGRSVTLSAQVDSGIDSTFAGWGGACSGTSPTCTLTMDGTKNVMAIFNRSDQPDYSIRVTKTGDGKGTVTSTPPGINCGVDNAICYAEFSQNDEVILTASAETGSVFAGWTGCSGSGNQCTVTVDGAKTVTATFNAQSTRQFTVTALMTTSGGYVEPSHREVFSGGTAQFTVTPNSDYIADEPVIDTCGLPGTLVGDTYTTGPVVADCTVTFKFKPKEIKHTVTAWAGSGGKIARSATDAINPLILTVIDQQSTTINVRPDDGFRTSNHVSGNCDGTLNGNVYTMNSVTAPCTAVFSFIPVEYRVSARLNDPNAGSIDTTARTVAIGQPVSFTVRPYKDYAVGGIVAGDGCGSGEWFDDNTYTTTPTGNDCELTFNLMPAAWYDLYRNWMIVPCLHFNDGTSETYWRLLMKTPTGTPDTPPYLILDAIYPVAEADHGFTPIDCASLRLANDRDTLHIPCYSELYKSQCHEMEFTLGADSAEQLIFQLQPRQDD